MEKYPIFSNGIKISKLIASFLDDEFNNNSTYEAKYNDESRKSYNSIF